MNYIATKPMKSKGLGFLLILIFGPIGLFYSTITGGIVMCLLAPILALLVMMIGNEALDALLLLFIPFYYIICFIWSYRSITIFNRMDDNNNVLNRIPNQQPYSYGTNYHSTENINETLSQKKNLLYKDLDAIKHLHYQRVISEEVFNRQRDSLLKQLEVLEFNERNYSEISPQRIEDKSYSEYTYVNTNRNSNLIVWIIVLLLFGSIIFVLYKKGIFKIDNHKQDRIEITNQIEKTYFGIINGGYTAQGMQGVGSEGIPFYNMKMDNLIAMGFLPLLNYFSSGLNLEAKNIDVYKFIDNNSAKVKYDLVMEDSSKNRSDTTHIDMIVKKIGGYWKLDGAKAFGDKSKKKNLSSHPLYNSDESKKNYIVKSISPYEAKQAFNNFIHDYINKYESNEPISLSDIADNGSFVIKESDVMGKSKSSIIDEAQFEKQIKKQLYDDFKFIKEEGGEFDSWKLKKTGNKFVISIDVNLTYYDFTFKINNNIILIQKIEMFFDT